MFTCFIRYEIAPGRLHEFEEYARAWIGLIEKYGGTHHGFFIPGGPADRFPEASFSYEGLGRNGPANIGVALFSFPGVEAYEMYRRDVKEDELCKSATARFHEAPCFTGYERTFLKPVLRSPPGG